MVLCGCGQWKGIARANEEALTNMQSSHAEYKARVEEERRSWEGQVAQLQNRVEGLSREAGRGKEGAEAAAAIAEGMKEQMRALTAAVEEKE